MTPERRALILEVLDGRPDTHLLSYLHHIDALTWGDYALRWLIKRSLTGDRFRMFLDENHLTPLGMIRYIRKALLHDVEERPVLAGRDYII